jgi:acetoin utilization deacetylase AcuC-like enzyme
LFDQNLSYSCTNSFAAIRPPGHHASQQTACGFCIYNNAAICAKRAIHHWKLDRILIVDWDVSIYYRKF